MQVSLRLRQGCGYTGDAKVSLRLGVALLFSVRLTRSAGMTIIETTGR